MNPLLFFWVVSPLLHSLSLRELSLNPEVASTADVPQLLSGFSTPTLQFYPKIKDEQEEMKLLFPANSQELLTGVHLSLGQLQGKFF